MPPCTRPLVLAFAILNLPASGCQPARPAPVADRPAAPVEVVGPDAAAPRASDEHAAVASTAPSPISRAEPLPTGRACRVHFRRDALGLASLAPLAVQRGRGSNRPTLIEGTIQQATDDWIVLRTGAETYWIPTDVILAVEFPEGR